MKDFDFEEDNIFVSGYTRPTKYFGDKESVTLYDELSLALELMKNDSFNVEDSGIGIGSNLWFSVTTPYPDGLPENVGTMFFNVNNNFNVKVQETEVYATVNKKHFHINIKKV